jgi:putative (di)nucleoside polyphosphate hydrolase
MPSQSFRIGVVIVVRGVDGQYLIFERGDIPGQWQFAQGGLDLEEEPIEAAWRELGEETGLGPDHVVAVAEFPEWVLYEYPLELRTPKGRRGQAHRWFLFDALHANIEPTPDNNEFVAWKWAHRDWVLDNVVEFRRAGYVQVLNAL